MLPTDRSAKSIAGSLGTPRNATVHLKAGVSSIKAANNLDVAPVLRGYPGALQSR